MNLKTLVQQYLDYCKQRSLDSKTLKAYRSDLGQFSDQVNVSSVLEITPAVLEDFLARLQQQFKPLTVKRKIASLNVFSIILIKWDCLSIILFARCRYLFLPMKGLQKHYPLQQ